MAITIDRTLDDSAGFMKSALEAGEGVLRLTPTWVPRSFLMPGRRLKLHPDHYYAMGAHRGGIDERWFGSTTEAANDNRLPDEGLSYVLHEGRQFTLRDLVAAHGAEAIGRDMFDRYGKWPVYSKFFDNSGPIPHHMHQNAEQAAKLGREGKPESYYFPPQLNPHGANFPYTFMGLEPGTTKEQVRRCLERWNEGDNGILDFSKAYRLQTGTGWLIPPCVLHAPGSLLTYEPQWGSDVFGMYQSMVEGRYVPWNLLVKDVPEEHHRDLDYLVEQLDWDANVNPEFKRTHFLEPVVADESEGHVDRWIVYGKVAGRQMFTAKELTVRGGASVSVQDDAASSVIVVQGQGRIGVHPVHSPSMIRYGENTEDEVFVTRPAAAAGVPVVNTGSEDLVLLRYFGPDAQPDAPEIGS